jgi:hypothetical protein
MGSPDQSNFVHKRKLADQHLPLDFETSFFSAMRRFAHKSIGSGDSLYAQLLLSVSHGTTYSRFMLRGYTIGACASHITEYRNKLWTWIGVIF